ncbi:MAG: alanine racemase [Holophagales bacterium]|nr:alanine racemase [Holophagales bacterium]
MADLEAHIHHTADAGRELGELPTPALVLDLEVLERNAEGMARRCRKLGVGLRPHFKTHKSPEIAAIQAELGAVGFTAATLSEARTLLEAGFRDVTWAFPLVHSRLHEVVELWRGHPRARLGLLVDSPDAVTALESAAASESPAAPEGGRPVWLEVDVGQHRSGVDPRCALAVELARRLASSKVLDFRGLLSHSGQAYSAPGAGALAAAAEEERSLQTELAERLGAEGIRVEEVSVGSTPGMSAVASLEGVTEARPGNYIFHDHTQVLLGACSVADCAVSVVSSVVSSQPGAGHCVIDAGALALSKDPGPEWVPVHTYGEVFADYSRGHLDPEVRVVSLSQEHGRVSAPLPMGTRIRISPNHSCLTVPCFSSYVAVRGDRVLGRIPIRHHPHQ